ncbi:Mrp/NBP35 family ATP-binding protein [Myxococcota bacterium]|nr:Mrp/NBP35 family ATP-binding protein [Myxococcota bacterium]
MNGPELETLEDIEQVRERVAAGLTDVERVIVVMSGKGGVGKSSVTVNLAQVLAGRGLQVGVLDADLQGPSVAKMMGLRGSPVRVEGGDRLLPTPGPCGVLVQSMDFFLQGSQALDWDGADGAGTTLRSVFEQSALADLLGQTRWGALDTLLVDLPPGADRLPALAQWLPDSLGEALIVTIPTEVALLAVERSIRRAYDLNFPLLGVVENLGTGRCSECGQEVAWLGQAPTEPWAQGLGLECVVRIPFDPLLWQAADGGESFLQTTAADSEAVLAFQALADHVMRAERPGREGESS